MMTASVTLLQLQCKKYWFFDAFPSSKKEEGKNKVKEWPRHFYKKKQFKKRVREILFAILHAEDTYVETPTFLLKMAKYVNYIN